MKIPNPGDKLYIPTIKSLHHGIDDIQGGIATVKEVISDAGQGCVLVYFEEIPDGFGLDYLEEHQEDWKELYGLQIAKEDPDYRQEFNEC